MRSRVQIAGVVALLSVAGWVSASHAQRPDLSGEWVRADSIGGRAVASVGDASFRRGDMGSGWGAMLTLAQRADSLVVQYDFFTAYDLQPRVRLAYALDGSESRNRVMIGHAESLQRSRVAWQGNTLVITTLHPTPGDADGRATSAEVRQVLSLDAAGSLIVETTRVGIRGAPTTATRTVYTKK